MFLSDYRSTNSTLYRICRYALPFQAGLLVLLGIASMIPICREEVICTVQNSFRDSLEPMLTWTNGSPPLWADFLLNRKSVSWFPVKPEVILLKKIQIWLNFMYYAFFSKIIDFSKSKNSNTCYRAISNNFAPPIQL